jgi:hypothetical protein
LQQASVFFFVNKKEAKKLYSSGPMSVKTPMPRLKKFFASFFQKRSLSFSHHLSSQHPLSLPAVPR